MSALLQARGLCYSVAGRPILDGVDFSIQPGECVALLGCNGAGKSTLLRLLLGLLEPQAGQVWLDGVEQRRLKRRAIARLMAYVPQGHTPAFPYRVRDIVLQGRIPLTGLGATPGRDDHQACERALAEVGAEHLAARVYTELSGGERQRVLIARALAQEARLLVLDEPVTGLDYGHQLRLLQRLKHLAGQGLAILSTTHHPEHALSGASRACVLAGGRLIADGPPPAVVTAALIQQLYAVEVRQIDLAPHRFFVAPE